MKKFEGKTLLELGTTMGSVDMVKYARENGAFVIVSDIDEPYKSLAKQFANKSYMVDLFDVDGLINIAKENHIDGVVTGASEAILRSSRLIAENLGLPIYFTEELWDRFMKKDSFRVLCKKYGISTPETYYAGKIENIGDISLYNYPVIIKPVDASSNVGISICKSQEELLKSLTHASESSKTKTVIIEQYIDGDEISCTYVIKDHQCKMVCMGTKYPYIDGKGLRAISNLHVYPSPSINAYMEQEDEKIKELFISEGLNNCTIFVQGIFKDQRCYIFEAGFRMEGTGTYRMTREISGQDFLHFQVDNALGVNSDYVLEKEDPYFGGRKRLLFSQVVMGGKIDSVKGFDEIKGDPRIFASEQRRRPGDIIEPDGTLRQIMFRYMIYGDNMKDAVSLIKDIQRTVKVFDKNGNNLLYTEFDPDFLFELW